MLVDSTLTTELEFCTCSWTEGVPEPIITLPLVWIRSLSVAFVYGDVVPVLKTIPPLLETEFDKISSLLPVSIADCELAPSCLNSILPLSPSSLLSVSDSIISTQSPDVPDERCNLPSGLSVPIPKFPSEAMRTFSDAFVSNAM